MKPGIVVINRAHGIKLCRWGSGPGYIYGFGLPGDKPGEGLSLYSGGRPTFERIRAVARREMGR